MRIDLKYPVTHNGIAYQSVTLRRPKGRDMIALERLARASNDVNADKWPAFIDVISALSDLPRAAVDEFDGADVSAIAEKVGGFFDLTTSPEPAAGAKS